MEKANVSDVQPYVGEKRRSLVNGKMDEIKSTAIVKYSIPKPANFLQLQRNTDLNNPPMNWLSDSGASYGLQHVVFQHKEFSSFRMAHMFPDCVGAVDVVSDSENIKKLLKIPYTKGHISMMVHRVENTLLLDDFDVYKHLWRTTESEWEWLKKFFYENMDEEIVDEERLLYMKDKKRKALKQRFLTSKFLYHSLVEGDGRILEESKKPLPVQGGPLLPEPSPKQEVPDPGSYEHKYNRNVVWTFEDIEMLIGTDLPIFGGGTHPCISLRLRDMKKPINVLTGIDYWLDNLMSNVPEVIMCYHLNGIVQKYELIKTEDLPSLEESKFSPKLIRDVAQSILSFLKSNATKAGHTYWLFKGKDDEVVKLYDLTCLCSDDMDGQNPFTVPVAMLLYRVGRNMKNSEERQPGTIRLLLKNCIKLLNEEKYPEIVTSSHYMLSDLYVPAATNPDNPDLEEEQLDDETMFFEEDDEDDLKDAMKILVLNNERSKDKMDYKKRAPPVAGSIEERCLQAISHVASGVNCLQYFIAPEEKRKENEDIPMAKPSEPIPMPFAEVKNISVKKSKKKRKERTENESPNALLIKNKAEAQPLPTWQGPPHSNISWKEHLKTLLYEKSVLVYAILSEQHFVLTNYGTSLRYIGLLARCLNIMNKLQFSICALEGNCLLGRAGDCCTMMVQKWNNCDEYRSQFHSHADEDLKMLEQIEKEERYCGINLAQTPMKCVLLYDLRTIEQMLLKAVECYEEARKLCDSESILQRLGNSLNEVGSFYLNKAKNTTGEDTITWCDKSQTYLKRAIDVFDKIKDSGNVALLYSNMGHLHRLLAHSKEPTERKSLTSYEKMHYNKACFNYKKALQALGERSKCPGIWEAVKWEMSTTYFSMSLILYDFPPKDMSAMEAQKEMLKCLHRALDNCDLDDTNAKLPLYQYRAAVIHHKIAALYHNQLYFHANTDVTLKQSMQLAKINYEKASKLFLITFDDVEYFKSELHLYAIIEHQIERCSNASVRLKHLQEGVDILSRTQKMVELIVTKKIEISAETASKFTLKPPKQCFDQITFLTVFVKTQMQAALKVLMKLCLSSPPVVKEASRLAAIYKECYGATFCLESEKDFFSYLEKLNECLLKITALVSNEHGS